MTITVIITHARALHEEIAEFMVNKIHHKVLLNSHTSWCYSNFSNTFTVDLFVL